jgi:ribosomal protein S17
MANNNTVNISHRKKGTLMKVIRVPKFLSRDKTIKVQIEERRYIAKYKRYQIVKKKHMVHYDPVLTNKTPQVGSYINVYGCRKLSSKKSMIAY